MTNEPRTKNDWKKDFKIGKFQGKHQTNHVLIKKRLIKTAKKGKLIE